MPAESTALDCLEEARGDDLVGVHIRRGQHDTGRSECGERLDRRCHESVRISAIAPVTAVAAAVSGLARNVRPPFPCRPSKFRLLVLTALWPGCSWSPFMAMHIEQPASRHSAPASLKIRSSPSASACDFTFLEPGTTSMRTPGATWRPRTTAAAWRRSEVPELVQLPTNTTSTARPSRD